MLRRRISPMTRKTMKITMKMKKSNFAIPTAATVMPPYPNKAATKAITRNTTAQGNSMDVPPGSPYTHATIMITVGHAAATGRWPVRRTVARVRGVVKQKPGKVNLIGLLVQPMVNVA